MILPFPPTTGNHQHITARNGRRFLRKDVKDWRDAVSAEVLLSREHYLGYEYLGMILKAYMPDNRKRDLGNIEKLVSDALQCAGAFLDDSLLHKIMLENCGVDKENPRVEVTLWKL